MQNLDHKINLLKKNISQMIQPIESIHKLIDIYIKILDFDKALKLISECEKSFSNSRLKKQKDIALQLKGDEKKQLKLSRFPILKSELKTLEETASKYVIGQIPLDMRVDFSESKIITLGSCFATNLSESLKTNGIAVNHIRYSEEINSTLANYEMLKWAYGQNISEELAAFFDKKFASSSKVQIKETIQESDLVIFTLGVAPCFFNKSTGEFSIPAEGGIKAWRNNYEFRNTSVEENIMALEGITDLIKNANSSTKLIFTLSPVPLKATLEDIPIFQADTVSKSILRVALDRFIRITPNVMYWPSYEIVRSLGVYFENFYGSDDGRNRHVSNKIVDVIIKLFIKELSK